MNSKDWQPMGYWNQVFNWNLNNEQVNTLADLCAAVASDERFTEATGCALIYEGKSKMGNMFFCPALAKHMMDALAPANSIKRLLKAALGIREFDRPIDSKGWDYFIDENEAFARTKFKGKRLEFARNLYSNICGMFLYQSHHSEDYRQYNDPGLIFTIARSAKRRFPSRRTRIS